MKALLPTQEPRYDMSQLYPLKAALEASLGHRVYLRLKETATLRDWKDEIQQLLSAIRIATKSTSKLQTTIGFQTSTAFLNLEKNKLPKARLLRNYLPIFQPHLSGLSSYNYGSCR
jgi:hypothetical protein